MRAPRVLVSGVVLGQPMGGVRRHNQELLPRVARILARDGGSLAVLEGRTPIAFELPREIERIASDVPAGPPLARATRETAALRRALSEARERGSPFDVVHVAHLPAPRALGVPLSITLHDLRGVELASRSLVRRALGTLALHHAVRRASIVLAVSRTVARSIERRWPGARVAVVGNGGDHFVPRARRVERDAPILHVGHLEPRKNVELLLRALAVDPSLPALELAGAAKPGEAERLRALAADLGVTERVRWRGAFDDADLPALYARAAAVVLPARLEGFGIAVVEAQRASCPLAIARAGALPEIAGPDVPSFAPDDPAECARAVHAALARPAVSIERDRVRAESYTWDAAASAWVEAWRSIAYDRDGATR